jgi:hypothetical protein
MSSFAKDIISSEPTTHGWYIKKLDWQKKTNKIENTSLGYYHSRLIFQSSLVSVPPDILGVRKLREELENVVKEFLENEVLPRMKSYTPVPRIFIYPIFNLGSDETFWKSNEERTYSLHTTCFYTELDDPKGRRLGWFGNSLRSKKVNIRISGAKIITSEMSNWFFWNLINLVFHEGLYRQSRETNKFVGEGVYPGLENRLEDFASSLIATFHDLTSTRVQDLIAKFALVLTILGILIVIFQIILTWFSHI